MNNTDCKNCGATFIPNHSKCEYCQSPNPSFKISREEKKDIVSEEKTQNDFIKSLLKSNEELQSEINKNDTKFEFKNTNNVGTVNVLVWILLLIFFFPAAFIYGLKASKSGGQIVIKIISIVGLVFFGFLFILVPVFVI